ncbi:apolipoprotein N-acyltransferase [bacterium]|nr:apolipoprotein N-acyltransferase [bacterium]
MLMLLFPPVREMWAHRMSLLWALGSVVLLWMCYPPLNAWPLGFVALVPWLWSLRRTSPRLAFWNSWLFGAVHFLTVFFWLRSLDQFNPAIWLGIPMLCLFKGFFYGLNGAGMVFFARRFSPWTALVAAVLWWVGWEWFRSVGQLGVPYALLGYTVRGFLPLAQLASIGGMVLVSAVVLAMNLALMETIAAAKQRMLDAWVLSRLAVAVLVIIGGAVWGSRVMSATAEAEEAGIPIRVALIQPNVEQMEKISSYAIIGWQEMTQAELQAAVAKMEATQDKLTLQMFDMLDAIEPDTVDLVVTPESAFTQGGFDHSEALQRELQLRADELRATIIVGADDTIFVDPDGEYSENPSPMSSEEHYGGLFVFRPGETEMHRVADYQKIHLMPFGETVPYFHLIPGLQEKLVQISSFLRGDKHQPPVFIKVPATASSFVGDLPQVHLGPNICFEDMFPYLHRRMSRRGVQVFVNITNDAWYDPTLGSRYHFLHVPMRCVETRLPMIRSTNSGVSALISGTGEVIARAERREPATLIGTISVPIDPKPTIYARLGDWFGLLAWFASLIMWTWLLWNRERRA